MHSSVLLDHFQNPRNAGELPPPALTVEVMNPACGDILRLSVEFVDGKAERAGFKVRGCTASIAAGSVLTELIPGRDAAALRALRADEIETALGGLIPESKHAAVLAINGVRAVLAAASESKLAG